MDFFTNILIFTAIAYAVFGIIYILICKLIEKIAWEKEVKQR